MHVLLVTKIDGDSFGIETLRLMYVKKMVKVDELAYIIYHPI